MTKQRKLLLSEINAFQGQIWGFYGHSGRKNLPWRGTKNAYKIMVSEVMLQQTQVARVIEKYPEFLNAFPNLEALANSSLTDVLRVWQGMGYNRRAKYLRDSAEKIISKHRGRVPKTERELLALPGIGHYTANAILTFTCNEPRVFIETNIRRVFIHHFFQLGSRAPKLISDAEILPLVEATLDKENPRAWYYALMDYGAHLPKVTHSNSNTQSKHYVKQSIFKGSLRELRGKIIRMINNESKSLAFLKRECDNDERTKDALQALTKDGLIKYEKRKYQLA